MIKIKTDLILSLLITLSMLFYAIRGKVGALLITLFIFIFIIYLIKNNKIINKSFSSLYAIFILIFALIFGISRNINFEFYLFIGYFAAALIDECGLKGKSIGGASVSEKHAGFIVNNGGATCRDIVRLADLVSDTVYKEKGVKIEKEMIIV